MTNTFKKVAGGPVAGEVDKHSLERGCVKFQLYLALWEDKKYKPSSDEFFKKNYIYYGLKHATHHRKVAIPNTMTKQAASTTWCLLNLNNIYIQVTKLKKIFSVNARLRTHDLQTVADLNFSNRGIYLLTLSLIYIQK